MKTEYKSDLKKNYLVAEPEEDVNSGDYDVRMMEQNQIQGFLPMQVRRLDGSCYLYYEITSMQQVDLVYGKRQLQRDDIRHIFSEVRDILESARKYLLRPGQILLDPQYMYMEPENGRISVCYLPVKESSFSVLPLAEFILKKLNHEDPDAVSLGYGFYQKAGQPNFSLSDVLHEMLAGTYRGGQESSRAGSYGNEGYGREGYERAEYEREGFEKAEYRKEGYGRTDRGNVYGDAYEDDEENNFYEIYHKGRKHSDSREKKEKKRSRIFQAVHPAILILTLLSSAGLGVLLYFQCLGFTETGGIFFILLSAAILANRFWKKRAEKKEKARTRGRNSEKRKKQDSCWEEDGFKEDPYLEEMQKLRAELYGQEREEVRPEFGYAAERKQKTGAELYGQEREEMRPEFGYAAERREKTGAALHGYEAEYKDAGEREIHSEMKNGRKKRTETRSGRMERKELYPENEYEQDHGIQERTRYLGDIGRVDGMHLLSEDPEKYPEIFIGDRILIVGKKENQADIILNEAAVSRIHARLEYHHGEYYVMDLGSRNGTYLNGMRLAPREQTRIRDGDRVAFANINYRVAAENELEMTQLLR